MTGDDLRDLRIRLRLSQSGFAETIGKSLATVHRYETGHTPIPDSIVKLTGILQTVADVKELEAIAQRRRDLDERVAALIATTEPKEA